MTKVHIPEVLSDAHVVFGQVGTSGQAFTWIPRTQYRFGIVLACVGR